MLDEIRQRHRSRQPVLVGTSSVEESERLSARLRDVPHEVLNARNEEAEAAIVARAGEADAVTISTNMAGRGVDIRLGAGVAELGGLHVIGTNRHESSRIDRQLRGRAGRQGDPGSSQFFVSLQDPLMIKYADEPGTQLSSCDHLQRVAEGQSLGCRLFLRKYETVVEGQRQQIADRRQRVLTGSSPQPRSSSASSRSTRSTISGRTIWPRSASFAPARSGCRSGAATRFASISATVHAMFQELTRTIDEEIATRLERAATHGIEPRQRGATWTYLTTDEPFGTMTERLMRRLAITLHLIRSRESVG